MEYVKRCAAVASPQALSRLTPQQTFALLYAEREYRLISYYNPKDAQTGVLPRASEVPMYACLETDPAMLANAKYCKTTKRERTQGFMYA